MDRAVGTGGLVNGKTAFIDAPHGVVQQVRTIETKRFCGVLLLTVEVDHHDGGFDLPSDASGLAYCFRSSICLIHGLK